MPKHSKKRKRDRDQESDDYVRKKMRKLEKLLRRGRRHSSSSSDSSPDYSHGNDGRKTPEDLNTNYEETLSDTFDPYDLLLNDDPKNNMSAPNVSPRNDEAMADNVVIENSQRVLDAGSNPAPEIASTAEKVPELDQDILDLLGETPTKEKKYGPNIKDELAIRWNHILTTGLTKEVRKELSEKYLVPDNCKAIDAPILNPEAKAALTEILVKKDKAIENKQKRMASAISSLGQAISSLFDSGIKEPSVVKPLLDAARLICDLQHTESIIRRSFICSSLKKDFKEQLYNTEIDKYLFSEKLADTLKTAKAIQKSGSDMKVPSAKTKRAAPTNRPLNSKPPLPNNRFTGVPRRQEPAAATSRRPPAAPPSSGSTAPPRSRPTSHAPPNQRRR